MRKSLGSKRKALSEEQIAEVTRLYAGFTEGERVKIFPTSAFGFQRITVEQPLRLRYEMTAATLPALIESKPWAKLSTAERGDLERRITALEGFATTDRRVMTRKIGATPTGLNKAVWEAVSVTDPEAPAVTTRMGEPEPDPDLRDTENVPLPDGAIRWEPDPTGRFGSREYRSAVEGYMAAEVLPYVPDAWVDHSKTRIGYEIPLTRHFYKYVPPRPLAEIDAEIKTLENEIQMLLGEVTG
jgi:type I restriction enzyme M protein